MLIKTMIAKHEKAKAPTRVPNCLRFQPPCRPNGRRESTRQSSSGPRDWKPALAAAAVAAAAFPSRLVVVAGTLAAAAAGTAAEPGSWG